MWYNLLFAVLAICFFFAWMRSVRQCENFRKWYGDALKRIGAMQTDLCRAETRLLRRERQVASMWKSRYGKFPKWAVDRGLVKK